MESLSVKFTFFGKFNSILGYMTRERLAGAKKLTA